MIWRVATSERFSDSLVDIKERWSLNDLMGAHDALDMYEELDAMAHEQATSNAGRKP